MPIIHINVKEKIAKGNKDEFIVCNNSDYEILFDFDKEWEEYNHKTAIVTLSNREFVPILFDGNKCKLPPLQNATFCKIGVMASLENDDATIRISTTTPASINCLESAYDENGEILPPTDDIYQQILAKLNDINTNISRGGTSVTVGGVEQKTWNADSKLDKFTEATQFHQLYGKTNTGVQKRYNVSHYNYAGNVPVYEKATQAIVGSQDDGGTIAVAIPLNPYQATPKKYVDDGLSGKLDSQTATSPQAYCVNAKGNYLNGLFYQLVNEIQNPNGSIPQYHGRCISVGTPIEDLDAANKKYVDTVSDGKVDKVTTAYKVYGTDENGNQKPYTTGYSPTAGSIQIIDYTPNGGYKDDGSFNVNVTGTHMVGIPYKPSHATPKKWVEDNFTVYKHIVSFSVYDYGLISCSFIVYSSQSTPFTADTLPNGAYVGWSGDLYNFLISNEYGSIYVTSLWGTIDFKQYLLGDELYIDSDIVTKL